MKYILRLLKVLSVKYRLSPIPSGGLEITVMLKSNCSNSKTFINMKQFVNKLSDYKFTSETRIEEIEDEEEIPTMVLDEDPDGTDKKTEEKMEDVSKPLVSYEINNEEEIETIAI